MDRAPTLKEELQRYVRYVHHVEKQGQGFETFEEADDFLEDDPEPDWESQYELMQMDDEPGFETPPLDPDETSSSEDQSAAQGGTDASRVAESETATDNLDNPAPPASSAERQG